jgi:hypothetical protein
LDVAYLSFATEIPGAGTIAFPTGTLNTSGNVNLVSFGTLAVLDDQYFGQTGDAYGGVAVVSGLSPLFGGNPELYQRVNLSSFDPAGTRATNGSSGGLVYQDVLGTRYALGIATHAQVPIFGDSYQYVRFDSPAFQAFHAANMAAVPEPGSLVLLEAFVVAGGACRLRRKCRTHQRELGGSGELC